MNNEQFFKNSVVTGQVLVNSFIFNILLSNDNVTFYEFINELELKKANFVYKNFSFFNKKKINNNIDKNKYHLLFYCGFFSNLSMLDFCNDYKINTKDFYVNFVIVNLLKEISIIYSVENQQKQGIIHFFNWFFNLKNEVQVMLLRNAILSIEIDNNMAIAISNILPYKNKVLKIPYLRDNIKSKEIIEFTSLLLSNFFDINTIKPLFYKLDDLENGAVALQHHVQDLHKFNDPRLLLDNIINKENQHQALQNQLKGKK